MNSSGFAKVGDVMELLGCKQAFAYKIIRTLNKELKAKGYVTISGRVPVKYLKERMYQE